MIDLHDQFIPVGKVMSAAAYNCSSNGVHGGGVILPVEIAAYGGTKLWDDQGGSSRGGSSRGGSSRGGSSSGESSRGGSSSGGSSRVGSSRGGIMK
jgi:hypothetical protein